MCTAVIGTGDRSLHFEIVLTVLDGVHDDVASRDSGFRIAMLKWKCGNAGCAEILSRGPENVNWQRKMSRFRPMSSQIQCYRFSAVVYLEDSKIKVQFSHSYP
jgi:hypothetical protein